MKTQRELKKQENAETKSKKDAFCRAKRVRSSVGIKVSASLVSILGQTYAPLPTMEVGRSRPSQAIATEMEMDKGRRTLALLFALGDLNDGNAIIFLSLQQQLLFKSQEKAMQAQPNKCDHLGVG